MSDSKQDAARSDDEAVRQYWTTLAKADHDASESYDKLLIALSSGALGLSMTFIKDIAPSPLAETRATLVSGWGCLLLSLLATLASLLTSQRALRSTMSALRDPKDSVKTTLATAHARGKAWSRWTHALNLVAAVLLTAGLLQVVRFAAKNYGRPHVEATQTGKSSN